MSKAAAKRKTTTVDDDLQQIFDAQVAKTQFVGATLNLSWRLALTVLIPLVGGIKVDERFNTSPSFTLAGLILASVGACIAIWSTVQEVNNLQAEEAKKGKKKKRA